ncbi:DUF4384 domain-containing protein [Odoribacter lunatus]|uniref:DUF4384 domain-containing protein n=1 Tax=Odoribacter lunatus TaxID=2941335 RepID=UPI00203C1E11|nr:DUF4384 domain-containing protein [Odoribacter lunatus]
MRIFLFILLNFFAISLFAQKIQTLSAEYIYHAPENITLEEAKQIALDRAKIQALADAFGTIVSQTNTTLVENRNGESGIDFFSIGGSEVKGEWIETIGSPVYDVHYEQGMLIIKVEVKGRAREVLSAKINIKARILRNATDDKYEDDTFYDGDDMYLSFVSPVSGYLAVYLLDMEKRAYCLLPYREQTEGIYKIRANQRYLFFHIDEAPIFERSLVDEYVMTCSEKLEQNLLYIIFSPRSFIKASDNNTDIALPRDLSYDDFQKWLANCRKHDTEMQLMRKSIIIRKK